MDRSQILNILKTQLPHLVSHFHVKTIGLFGSYARNQASQTSDVDILVEACKQEPEAAKILEQKIPE